MFEKILVIFIITCCSFFIGRRFYRQWKSVTRDNETPCCSDGCSSCGVSSNCESKK